MCNLLKTSTTLILCLCLCSTLTSAEAAEVELGQPAAVQVQATEAATTITALEQSAGLSLTTDYTAVMVAACLSGDHEAGRAAQSYRDRKIDLLGLSEKKFTYDDLLELSRLITSEAGSSWLTEQWRLAVGEVVLNRVASPEYPNTISEVIHQAGQYSGANSTWFSTLTPFDYCVDAAVKLLRGYRAMEPTVVFQSGARQGSGTYLQLYDSVYGYTYFCRSSHPELY
jgi:hypothetical protein